MSKFAEHAAEVMAHMHKRYEAGDKAALLDALRWCLAFNVLAPDWVRAHVNSALIRYLLYEAATLDEAFSVVRSKDPRSLAAGRRAVKLIGEVTMYISSQQKAGSKLDDEFFAAVGRKFGIGKTTVKEYWRKGREAFSFPTRNR